MAFCKGRTREDLPCSSKMVMASGFCIKHDPDSKKEKDYLKAKEDMLVERERDIVLREQMIDKSLEIAEIEEVIGRIQDLESLKSAELAIIQGLVSGKIDPKSGGPVASLLKHHADLLAKEKPAGGFKEEERKMLLELSVKLSLADSWALIQDVTSGMKGLLAKANEAETITINAEGHDDGVQDIGGIGVAGLIEARASEDAVLSEPLPGAAEIQGCDSGDTGGTAVSG